jgi:phage gp29-like protein
MSSFPTLTFTPQTLAKLKDVAKAKKIAKTADAVNQIVEIVGQVATSIITTSYAIKNEEQRQLLLGQIQYLDEKQATELENSLRALQTQDARLGYMMDFLSKVEGEKSANKIKSSIENKNLGGVMGERKKIFLIFGGVIVLLVGLIIIKKVTK